MAEVAPVLEPFQVGIGLAEELQLHLLKLAHTEDEVAGGDLIAEALADLTNAEGQLAAGRALDIHKVDKDALCGFRTQINGVLGILGNALEGLEHQVELADIGKVVLAAGGAGDIVLLHKIFHLRLGKGIDGAGQLKAVLGTPVLNDFIGTEALVAFAAVHQRVGKAGKMAGGHPGLGVHQDGGILADIIGVLLDEFLPPGALDVVLQLHAQGAVIPGVGQSAVNLAAGVNKPAVLTQVYQGIHRFFGIFHVYTFLLGIEP